MGIRLFLRPGRDRAERGAAAGLVQEARLDLRRGGALALLSLLLAAGGAGRAAAQKLLPDGPLTTLMQPQKLDRSRPLLPQEPLAGVRPDGQAGLAGRGGASPCERGGGTRRDPVPPPRGGGGSGPGDYGRYMPGGAPSAAKAAPATGPAAAPNRAPGADRPLLGGTDRPLWASGERSSPAGPAGAGKPGAADPAGPGAAASAAPDGVAAPPRDRPLWADGTVMTPADPAAGTDGAGSLAPCVGGAAPLLR